MKGWPADHEPVDFQSIVQPLVRAVKAGYSISRKTQVRAVPYDGLDIAEDHRVEFGSVAELLSAGSLSRLDRDGVSLLEVLVSVAVLLGMEQGRRLAAGRGRLTNLGPSKTEDPHKNPSSLRA